MNDSVLRQELFNGYYVHCDVVEMEKITHWRFMAETHRTSEAWLWR